MLFFFGDLKLGKIMTSGFRNVTIYSGNFGKLRMLKWSNNLFCEKFPFSFNAVGTCLDHNSA